VKSFGLLTCGRRDASSFFDDSEAAAGPGDNNVAA
jgi:hypothetical protein